MASRVDRESLDPEQLRDQLVTELYLVYRRVGRWGETIDVLCQRLNGAPKYPCGDTFIPIQEVDTEHRFYAFMGCLSTIDNPLEVLAWQAE